MRLVSLALLIVVASLVAVPASAATAQADRPKVGLALSGGGARGGAHIGVLKALEEMHVPIDYIAGTSMGAIVGAMYSAGYTPDEILRIMTETDWTQAFSDQPDRRSMTMRKKELDADFLIPHRIGFNHGEIQLPLGVIEGQQLDFIFQRVFLPVREISDFDRLPVPFRAIATDLVTGGEVVMSEGNLTEAVRASMSIPGLFAPVIIDDRMLVDGGMANNLPVSVVRAMGADIVIAVDISSPLLNRDEIESVLTVTEQLTNFLTRGNTEQQIASLGPQDILLTPDLKGFGSTDFDKVADIVPAGYESVMANTVALAALVTGTAGSPATESVLPLAEQADYIVQFIEVTNESVLDDEIIRSRLDVPLGEPLDFTALERNINDIYSIDVFQTVSYDLVTNEAGETGIEVVAIPRNWGPNYLQFGLEFSDDFGGNSTWGMGAAYTRNALNALGGELRVSAAIGTEGELAVDFYQPIDKQARWFTEARAFWLRQLVNVYDEDNFLAEVEVSGPGVALGLGRNFSTTDLVRLDYQIYRGKATVLIGEFFPGVDVDIGELVLQYRHDSLDDLWFPTDGTLFNAAGSAAFEALGAQSDYQRAYAGGSLAHTWGKNTAQLNFQAGYSFEDDVPIERWFELGGLGRLSGLAPDQLAGRHLGLLSLAMYRRLNEVRVFPLYAGFTLETGNVWQFQSDISFDSLRYSGSVFVGANTPIGPIYLAYGHSDNGDGAIYFYLGNPWRADNY